MSIMILLLSFWIQRYLKVDWMKNTWTWRKMMKTLIACQNERNKWDCRAHVMKNPSENVPGTCGGDADDWKQNENLENVSQA